MEYFRTLDESALKLLLALAPALIAATSAILAFLYNGRQSIKLKKAEFLIDIYRNYIDVISAHERPTYKFIKLNTDSPECISLDERIVVYTEMMLHVEKCIHFYINNRYVFCDSIIAKYRFLLDKMTDSFRFYNMHKDRITDIEYANHKYGILSNELLEAGCSSCEVGDLILIFNAMLSDHLSHYANKLQYEVDRL